MFSFAALWNAFGETYSEFISSHETGLKSHIQECSYILELSIYTKMIIIYVNIFHRMVPSAS